MSNTSAHTETINKVVEAHQFDSTSSTRGGIVRHRAGCTCDPTIEFNWYEREAEHKTHLYAAIFEAGRTVGIFETGQAIGKAASQTPQG